jgi:hypothetical protein
VIGIDTNVLVRYLAQDDPDRESSMRNCLLTVFALATLAATNGFPAKATTYDFAYTFDTGAVVTGSFDGIGSTTSGVTTVTDLSNVSMSVNGTAFAGTTYIAHIANSYCDSCWEGNGAIVSSDPYENNFWFSNASEWFYIAPWYGRMATQVYFGNNNYIDYYNGRYIPANWSLVAASTGTDIPSTDSDIQEPAAMIILGVGLTGLGYVRRRRA